jgi:hypothetical protein
MPGFLYFLPSAGQTLSSDDLLRAGLGYAMPEPAAFTPIQLGSGPAGDSPGFLMSMDGPTPSPRVLYRPAEQIWRKAGGGAFWVGLWKDDPRPGPDDLARGQMISGEPIRLRDGNHWTIPICLSIVRGSTLPKALVLGEDGQTWQLEALPEFVALCKDAESVWEAFRAAGDGSVKMDAQAAPRIAADAMAVNYRIGPLEISLLKLWSSDMMWNVLKAIIDGYALTRMAREAAEKKTSASVG